MPPRTTPPQQTSTPPPGVARSGAIGAAAGGAVGATPGVLGTLAATDIGQAGAQVVQQAVEHILQAFAGFLRRARTVSASGIVAILRQQHPEEDDATLRRLVRDELDREAEFQRKMMERLRRDLPSVLALRDPTQRNARMRAILDRERRYLIAREEAIAERALGAVERLSLKRISPQGAFWTLGEDVKQHTLDCLVLANQFWPWEVLDTLHPPLHHGCACGLLGLNDAVAHGLMHPDQVPNTRDAVRRARRAYARAKALEHAAGAWEVDEYLTALEEGSFHTELHPRDRRGRFIDTPAGFTLEEAKKWIDGAQYGAILYHGTRAFKVNAIKEQGLRANDPVNYGVFATTSRKMAKTYGDGSVVRVAVRLQRPMDWRPEDYDAASNAELTALGYDGILWRGDVLHEGSARETVVEILDPKAIRVIGGQVHLQEADWTPDLHPRDRRGRWAVMYHVAPKRARSSIEAGGLHLAVPDSLGVWTWDTLDAAKRYGVSDTDVWEVNVEGLEPKYQSNGMPNPLGKAYLLPGPIDRKRIKRVASRGYHGDWKTIEEAFNPDLHPRDRAGKFAHKLGLRKAVERELRSLIPHKPETPAHARKNRRGEWHWAGGHRVFVPEHRQFTRRMGGATYTSPPGSTDLYRDGKPTADKVERATTGALALTAPSPDLLSKLDALRTPARVHATTMPVGELRDRPPRDWGEFQSETEGLVGTLAQAFGAVGQAGDVLDDHDMWDHAGGEDWRGNIHFGRDVRRTIERDQAARAAKLTPSDRQMADTYNAYRVQAHEAAHAVNPADRHAYTMAAGQVLEEGLTEEVGHAILRANLERHGHHDVIAWADAHPDAEEVKGTYRSYREALYRALDGMGVPRDEQRATILHLKFITPPAQRLDEMERIAHAHRGDEAPSRADLLKKLRAPLEGGDFTPRFPGDPGLKIDPGTFDAAVPDRLVHLHGKAGSTRLHPPAYSPEVAAIEGHADAERYLHERFNITAKLDPSKGNQKTVPVDFYRQMAQAVTDAEARNPTLQHGERPLRGVVFISNVQATPEARRNLAHGIWAVTGPNPETTNMVWFDHDSKLRPPGDGTWIILNDLDAEEVFQGPGTAGDGTAWADQMVYGETTHELGHAVAMASGFTFSQGADGVGDPEINKLNEAGVTPRDMQKVSPYGASNPWEAWAEAYTTLNSPGALDLYSSGIRERLLGLRDIAVYNGEKLL